MSCRHPNVLSSQSTLLVLVDLQEPFLRGVVERERVVERTVFLAAAAAILNVPIIASVQNIGRMGGIIPEIATAVSSTDAVDKMTFSCAGDEQFMERLRAAGRRQILLAGVETHICVAQTALDLLHRGYQIHVAADAVSSRGMDLHKLGMEKMRDCGVIPCAAEQAVYELMEQAGTLQFKAILNLVKA